MPEIMQAEMSDARIIQSDRKSFRYPVRCPGTSHVARLPKKRYLTYNQSPLLRSDTTPAVVFMQQRHGVVVEINTVRVLCFAFLPHRTASALNNPVD